MNKREFLEQRKVAWKRFETLVDLFGSRVLKKGGRTNAGDDRGGKKPRESEISEFSRLFREIANDLATVRSRGWGEGVAAYLNDLLTRAHSVFYTAPPADRHLVVRYLMVGFPKLFRANFGYFLTAAALFFGPLALAWAVVQNDPTVASRVIPNEQLEMYKNMYAKKKSAPADKPADATAEKPDEAADPAADESESESDWDEGSGGSFGDQRSIMFGFYVRNNIGIAFRCFALGVMLGVGTVYTLLFNGIVIGSVAGYVCSQGGQERFLTFVFSHGSFELTAIAVAGGAGLMLGNAVIHPGNRTRREALPARALDAIQIALGAGVMLFIAALIEAYWSPSSLPFVVKMTGGALMWLSVALYLGFAGRGK